MTIRKNQQPENTLIANMFGNFSMSYNGKAITSTSKSSESQFNYLMEMIIHSGPQGVSRDSLVSMLFAGRDLNNANHAIQSILYNAKVRLRESGLPDIRYFIYEDGMYHWNYEIPILEDAREFERIVSESEKVIDLNARMEILLGAIHMYSGDFLEKQIEVSWITRENWRYRKLFEETANMLADIIRLLGKYQVLETVGRFAARVQPFNDWEILTMEAYVSTGRQDKAYKLFEDTVDMYIEKQGIKPSNKMFDFISRLGSQFSHSSGTLYEIQQVKSDAGEAYGGFDCSYPIFAGIYQVINRISERSGQMIFLMLCTIVDTKGNVLTKGSSLDELSQRLDDAIRQSIRRSDIMCKYNKSQFLVMLMDTTAENCKIVQRRINDHFMINRQRISVQYTVNSIW
ncbi:MAG: diguanylate cyclase [Erysipelotrichaceae bacterium]|nr:diguanylate cyclase [Erysipelotrichaceae bacterium]